jgi:dipeptidyl-peptidase-4
MTSAVPELAMSQRYARAVGLTAPKIAVSTSGNSVEGYWLDERHFFFLAERIEPSLGRMLAHPSIANCETARIEEVISLKELVALLSHQLGYELDMAALSSAEFDMPDSNTLGISVGARDFLVEVNRRVITSRASLETSALYSPDGRYACFVKGHDLWLRERNTGAEQSLTHGGTPHSRFGQQSETGLSAVSYRKRPSPVALWSPDSQWLLTYRVDEQSLPELALIQHSPPGGGRPVLHRFKYPMPGDPLPTATYAAIHIASGRVVSFDDVPAQVMGFPRFFSRMAWFDGAHKAWFVRIDRYAKQADLVSLDLASGASGVVLSERTVSGYLELNPLIIGSPNVRILAGSNSVIWFSERDGWGHLYLYDAVTGRLKNRITTGSWSVRDIVQVDEERGKILFLASGMDASEDPTRRSLCAVNLDGTHFKTLLTYRGDIFVPKTEPCGLDQDRPFRPANSRAGISPDGRFAVVRYASIDRGNRTEIVELSSGRGFPIASAQPALCDVPPRQFMALAADGKTRLDGVMFLPADFDESRRYPLIDYIYPGPQVAQLPQSFRSVNSSHAMALAELGFVTIMLNTRGVPFGSRAAHQIGYGALLEPQLADHAAVIRQLCEQHPYIDRERIGILGESAGGAATARALFDYSEIFKVGVAACGNHDPTFYSAYWSDKYRGPDSGDAWAGQANSAAAHKLKGKLLLISGDMDENVHLSQTLSLVDALVRANRDFDLLIIPNEGHTVLFTSGYAQRRAWDYFVRNLLGEAPPPNFELKFEPYELARFAKVFWREVQQ